jgi:hypothetical protein
MKQPAKMVLLGLAVLAFGAVRLPYELGLTRDLRAAGLLSEPLEIGTRDRIGQTSSAVALGGLRTLVASFLHLRAYTYFIDRRWADVEATFETIVDLAPRTRYYWETAAWHMAYNAASYYINDSELPPLRRREAWRAHVGKGRSILERGVRNNPDDWSIMANLGFLLTDSNKIAAFPDPTTAFADAADAYQRAVETGEAPPHLRRLQLYAMARVPERESEALALARELHAESPTHHLPTLLSVLLVLEVRADPTIDTGSRARELFGTPERAYQSLSSFWLRTEELFPADGVAAALQHLEKILSIPAEKSVFNRSLQRPSGPDDWFDEPAGGRR